MFDFLKVFNTRSYSLITTLKLNDPRFVTKCFANLQLCKNHNYILTQTSNVYSKVIK